MTALAPMSASMATSTVHYITMLQLVARLFTLAYRIDSASTTTHIASPQISGGLKLDLILKTAVLSMEFKHGQVR
jgi:hypothetical protein